MKKGLVLLCLLGCFSAFSQNNELELDPVTITASLHPSPVSRTGRNITVVNSARLQNLPAHSLDELLRFVPGIELQLRGPAGSQSDIVIRGGTFQQVLVIMDGIRLNDPITGHFNSYIPIIPSEIERIEILKGASSAIYGSEAVGGVINIISKTFAAKTKQDKKQARLRVTGGAYSLLNMEASGQYQSKGWILGGGVLSNNSDGQAQRGIRGYFHNNTASISLKKIFSDHFSIAIRSSYDKRNFSAQNFYTTFVSDTAREKVNSCWNQLSLQYQKGRHQLDLAGGFKTARDQYRYNPASIPNDNRSRLGQIQLTDHYRINSSSSLTGGLQYISRVIRSNDRGNHQLSQYAAFIILDKTFGALSISPSLRLDQQEIRGTELVPQLNLSYKLKSVQLRASAGKTIRDADFTERYNNYNKAFVSGGSIGNPDLEAERSFSYEAGADVFVSTKWKIAFTVFQRRQQELIDYVTTPYANMPRKVNLSPTGTYALASNIAKVNTSGVETDIQFRQQWQPDHFLISSMGLLWLDSKTSNKTNPSFYLSSHARFLVNWNAQYQQGKWSLSAAAIYKDRRPLTAAAINASLKKDLFQLNLRTSYKLWKDHISVFAEVDNVFDSRASDLLGTYIPGRWGMVGIVLF